MLVIETQVYENYAAHGGFTGEYYWKAKGGSSYKVLGVPDRVDLDEIVSILRPQIERSNDYVQETIIGYGTECEGYLSPFEQSQLEYDGEILFPEPTIEYSDLVESLV